MDEATADLDTPLGIAIEGWPYPAPVKLLPLEIDGRRVSMAYMDIAPQGAANGRTVLLLHGKNFDSSYWSRPIEGLVRAGYRVVVPDQVGFNKSAKPDLDYTFDLLAQNTLTLVDRLGVDRFDLVGHSTGGGLAIVLAASAPQRVHRLVLEDPIGIVTYRDHIPEPTLDALIDVERGYTVDSYRAFVSHFFNDVPAEEYEPFVTWRMRVRRSAEFERFARASALTYLMIHRQPLRGRVSELTMPILLTAGSEDHSTPMIGFAPAADRSKVPTIPQVAEELAGQQNVDLRRYPGIGHVPHLDAQPRFNDELIDFLEDRQ